MVDLFEICFDEAGNQVFVGVNVGRQAFFVLRVRSDPLNQVIISYSLTRIGIVHTEGTSQNSFRLCPKRGFPSLVSSPVYSSFKSKAVWTS